VLVLPLRIEIPQEPDLQPQGDRIVSYGPFIGDSKQDIVRLYTEIQTGQFVSLSELVKGRLIGRLRHR